MPSIKTSLALLALLSGGLAAEERNLVVNGGADSKDGWSFAGGGEGVDFDHDADEGATGKGSLHIHKSSAENRSPSNWNQGFDIEASAGKRLEVRARLKAKGLVQGSQVCVMVQNWVGETMRGGAWSEQIGGDTDWREVSAVWELPEGTTRVRVLAYLVGKGDVWFDDFVVTPSEKPITPAPGMAAPVPSRYEELVRRCAEEIPWRFDGVEASKESEASGKPILIYVRCTDTDEGIPSARETLPAKAIPFREDGLRKDILFRAGPLSDPDVAALVERRFVPLCVTYSFAVHAQGRAARLPAHTDPLEPFGGSCKDLGTPALLVTDGRGRIAFRLHRLGALSADHIDLWLRETLARLKSRSHAETLADLLADGELEKVIAKTQSTTDPEERLLRAAALLRTGELDLAEGALAELEAPTARYLRGVVAMRRGQWRVGLAAFETVAADESDPAAEGASFWAAWCQHFLGEQEAARDRWQALAGESRFGKKAAACVLPSGPQLWLSETVRPWPRIKNLLTDQSEGVVWGEFDAAQSVLALLELQFRDGSFFGQHASTAGERARGHSQAAITALAADALALWLPAMPGYDPLEGQHEALAARVDTSRERALEWLTVWARGLVVPEGQPAPAGNVFTSPYVLTTLLAAGRKEDAAHVVAHIAATQLPDGAWTVYHPQRTASFNTALNILALRRAEDAGLEVPEGVLDRGVKALEAMRTESGRFPYSPAKGHEWMSTEHGSIARDPLCEHALIAAGVGSPKRLAAALGRFREFHAELREPTKRYYDFFNMRGHGGYYFFFAHHNVLMALPQAKDERLAKRVAKASRRAVLAAREADGTFMDQYSHGRTYGTAMALILLAPR